VSHRGLEQARKIKMRVGGTADLLEPFPARQRGMRRRTFQRLWARAEAVWCCPPFDRTPGYTNELPGEIIRALSEDGSREHPAGAGLLYCVLAVGLLAGPASSKGTIGEAQQTSPLLPLVLSRMTVAR
jgi:hypothetical protein